MTDLQEQLRSAEVKRCRIIEAFKKTSHDFREVCCQLTGFRIDGLANNQYRLTSIYAELPDRDQLLFQRDSNGACLLLETNYSNQLEEFIDLVGTHEMVKIEITYTYVLHLTAFEDTKFNPDVPCGLEYGPVFKGNV